MVTSAKPRGFGEPPKAPAKLGAKAGVLLVDDHPVNRLVIRLLLEPLGIEVVEAVDGSEAVLRFGERAFDAVLMDLQMPVMDGLEATRAIRRLERDTSAPPTRIIVITATVSEANRTASIEAGADDFQTKPVNPERLVRSVFAAIGANRRPARGPFRRPAPGATGALIPTPVQAPTPPSQKLWPASA